MKVVKILLTALLFSFMASCASTSESGNGGPLNETEKEFVESLNNYKLTVISSPKNTEVDKPFAAPYVVQVKTVKGAVVPDFSVTVSYPAGKKNAEYVYKTEVLTTNKDGKVSFLPPVYSFTANTKIEFYVTPVAKKKLVIEAVKEKSVKADFKINSKFASKGAILAVWDFDERDKPSNNFFYMNGDLQDLGTTKIGNAPFSDISTLKLTPTELYKKNVEIIGNTYGYLVGGTVKYEKPYEKGDDGFTVYVIGEFWVINMENGEEVYRTTIKKTATDVKYNDAVKKAKRAVSRTFVEEIAEKL